MNFNYEIDISNIFNKCNELTYSISDNVWSGQSKENFFKQFENFINEYKVTMEKQVELLNSINVKYSKYIEEKKELEQKNKMLNTYTNQLNKLKDNILDNVVAIKIKHDINNLKIYIDNNLKKIENLKKQIIEDIEQIKKLGKNKNILITGITIPERNDAPVTTDGVSSKWYSSDDNWYWRGGNINQCTGYAFGRFNEIAAANGCRILDSNKSMGNGKDFYSMGTSYGFNTSNKIEDIQNGDTISWAYSNAPYGHVSVVENVTKNKNGEITSVTISEGKMYDGKGAIKYKKTTYTGPNALNDLKNRSIRRGSESIFQGLVHQTKNKE